MEGQEKEASKKRKYLERSLFLLIAILVLLAFVVVANRSGWRLEWYLQKINYLKYGNTGPDFSFRYPDYFSIDPDTEKRFGADYITGFKLNTDRRAGCDIRTNSFGLNFKKSDQEIQDAIEKDLKKNATDFSLTRGYRMKIGGENAYMVEFGFLDPTGNRVQLSQVLASHDGTDYLIACGTGDYQYKYLKNDFYDFYDHFQWGK